MTIENQQAGLEVCQNENQQQAGLEVCQNENQQQAGLETCKNENQQHAGLGGYRPGSLQQVSLEVYQSESLPANVGREGDFPEVAGLRRLGGTSAESKSRKRNMDKKIITLLFLIVIVIGSILGGLLGSKVDMEKRIGKAQVIPPPPTGTDDVTLPSLFSNLYFVKTQNEGSGRSEVYVAKKASNYGTLASYHVSGYELNEGDDGVFVVNDRGLYFIKRCNTGTGTVEIHRTTASSGYKTFDIHSGSAFSLDDSGNGTWIVDGEDLYFISAMDTSSGKIEVYRASHPDYSPYDLQKATSIPSGEDSNGTWQIFGGNLYFIKYRNTGGSNVEVQVLDANNNYQRGTTYESWFDTGDGDNGTWDIGLNGDLYFIKTRNTGSGMVEVHIATAETNYTQVYHYPTWIGQADGSNGTWGVY